MTFIEMRSFNNRAEAGTILRQLQQARVNCHLERELSLLSGSIDLEEPPVKLMVHAADIEKAWDMLELAEEQYLRTIRCPVCKAKRLKAVVETKEHRCRLAALASMMLKGKSIQKVVTYRCGSCGYDFRRIVN
jgi:DNA-directed RNA polymerase subunit RPC12/RpoP